MSQEEFARTYSAMADEELVELSRESASLVDRAQKALQTEMDRRGLKPALPEPAVLGPGGGNKMAVCSGCGREATDPLTCGSCSALICRACGTPLEIEWDEEPLGEEESTGEGKASGQTAG